MTLRDFLAGDRTVLANERTVLAYFRTFLNFLIVGISLIKLFASSAFFLLGGYVLIFVGIVTLCIGIFRYVMVKKKIEIALTRDFEVDK